MAKPISDEMHADIKELIAKITRFQVGSSEHNSLEKCVLATLKKADTMYFLNTKDVRKVIWSMADKFTYHGFFKHAEHLKACHDRYIDKNLSESDLTPRLNIVKFLLCMSDSPTTHFWQHPDQFEFINEKPEEEVVDWGAYLTEGVPRWSPDLREDSFSDSSEETPHDRGPHVYENSPRKTVIEIAAKVEKYEWGASREALLERVQSGWFGGQRVCMQPPSQWFDANVGLLWEQHLKDQTRGLVEIAPVTVISEYKVMREILWQMWGPHTSTVFELRIDKLVPRRDVTISSVCSMTFEDFMRVFVPYIELLDDFRQFQRDLEEDGVPETYKSYGNALRKITKPVFNELVEIEAEIRDQDTTMTLLKLAGRLEAIFEPIRTLKIIHDEVVVDFKQNSPLICALTLLTRLRKSLQFCLNKLEQDIRLTLYLESLYYYFTLINAWLVKNDLSDYTNEFVVVNTNQARANKNCDNPQMNFFLCEEVEDFVEQDALIKIIADQVLHIGRNIHLLRLLGKYDVFAKGEESLHEEFVGKILDELSEYYRGEKKSKILDGEESKKVQKVESSFEQNRMGDWTNFVDLSDGFLIKAFESFYFERVEVDDEVEYSLFRKINEITTNLYPLQGLPEKIFSQILRDRFTISGLMVKNLLIENYLLDKQFEFLNHIFLFNDDLIFPFYRRLFEKMNIENGNWGNSVWLTSHLQDLIMDLYPNFYENCKVQVRDYWKQCRDSLEACTLVNLQYEIKWPLSIIITGNHLEMYKEIFQFILKLKWALYTTNHLSFTDVEPRKTSKKPARKSAKKLKYLRFNLINALNTIQHYFFASVFTKNKIQFELEFEKANDLKSLIAAHDRFITSVARSVAEICDRKHLQHGFDSLLKSVKMLKVMWKQQEHATWEHLEGCRRIYRAAFEAVASLVNPVYVC